MKKKILIVIANYYAEISDNLRINALEKIKGRAKIKVILVPGVFEIPVVISQNIKKYNAFVALGCVIKGETPHFEFISQSATDAIMQLSINSKKPIGNGILTCLNSDQAIKRSKTKGSEAVYAVLKLLDLISND
jgi:6,7-dimethyl-8-ribityllumazine synthase